jgi:hypothetical protein
MMPRNADWYRAHGYTEQPPSLETLRKASLQRVQPPTTTAAAAVPPTSPAPAAPVQRDVKPEKTAAPDRGRTTSGKFTKLSPDERKARDEAIRTPWGRELVARAAAAERARLEAETAAEASAPEKSNDTQPAAPATKETR